MTSYKSGRPLSDFDIHKTGTHVFSIDNLFPYAFAPVQRDRRKGYGKIMHGDGDGSKPVQAYLHWKETGDINVFEWTADGVVAMNLDDVYCVATPSDLDFSDYVAVNRFRMPKEEFLRVLNNGFRRIFGMLEKYGIRIGWHGGETAEISDQTRTVDAAGTIYARFPLKKAVTGENIKPGDVIIGLGSYGKAVYEEKEPGRLMSNGLTVVRHCLMTPDYVAKYPEIADPVIEPDGKMSTNYRGRYKTDQFIDQLGMTIGEAIISPTRIFAPVIKTVVDKYGKDVHGIVHNTGGGLTKGLRVGRGIHYVKDSIPPSCYLISLIQQESGRTWESIYEGLCNDIGMEVIVPREVAAHVMEDIDRFNIPVSITGHCEANIGNKKMATNHGNRMTIISEHGIFEYPYEEAAKQL